VLIGFFAALIYLVMSQFILVFRPAEYDSVQGGMQSIFGFAPRIVLASLTAYIISQLHDVWAYHFIKEKTQGRMLWLRNNGSTWISQLIDSVTFSLVAFLGTFEGSVILQIIVTTYVLKVFVAILDTPFIYLSYKVRRLEL